VLSKQELGEILAAALSQGGDFADIFLERKETNAVGLEADKVERVVSGLDAGAGVRVIFGENTAYAYTNDTSKKGLLNAAQTAARAARGGQKEQNINLTALKPVVDFDIKNLPNEVKIEDKVDLVERANRTAREMNDQIKQVMVGYGDMIQEVTIANSEGDYVEDRRIRTRMMVHAVAGDGKTIQTGYEAAGGFSGLEIFQKTTPEFIARAAANRAILMLTARPAPAGKMTVVMAGGAGGTMIHEACGHGLEADLIQKQLSVYSGKMGDKVASELVNVIDDATVPNQYGSYRFDDEGVPGQKTVLIENGVLKGYMYDRLTSFKDQRPSTGNGRRESYQHKPIPRMSNTYLAAGKTDPDQVIRNTKHGLLVNKMGGGQVNTTNGDFVFEVAEGYLIEDGEVKSAVRGATLTGNGPDALRIVDMVGSDSGCAIGTCGKDGQGVAVSDAQPTIRIPELVVGGILEDEEGDGHGR